MPSSVFKIQLIGEVDEKVVQDEIESWMADYIANVYGDSVVVFVDVEEDEEKDAG